MNLCFGRQIHLAWMVTGGQLGIATERGLRERLTHERMVTDKGSLFPCSTSVLMHYPFPPTPVSGIPLLCLGSHSLIKESHVPPRPLFIGTQVKATIIKNVFGLCTVVWGSEQLKWIRMSRAKFCMSCLVWWLNSSLSYCKFLIWVMWKLNISSHIDGDIYNVCLAACPPLIAKGTKSSRENHGRRQEILQEKEKGLIEK